MINIFQLTIKGFTVSDVVIEPPDQCQYANHEALHIAQYIPNESTHIPLPLPDPYLRVNGVKWRC